MGNYKIKVSSEAESKEAQELLFELGYKWIGIGAVYYKISPSLNYITAYCEGKTLAQGHGLDAKKEITIPQLKDMVVLKRNDVSDKNVADGTIHDLYQSSNGTVFFYHDHKKKWIESGINKSANYMADVKPITKEPIMKEFLNKLTDGTYKLVVLDSVADGVEGLIEIPEGGNFYCDKYFWKQVNSRKFWNGKNWQDDEKTLFNFSKSFDAPIVWQRSTPPEELPFIDDEPKYDPEDIKIAKDYDLDELAKEYKLRDRCEGETDEEYRYMLEHCIDLENYIAKETLNDKVASAEVARQEFIGVPFSDLPELEADGDAVKHSHYKKDISHFNTLDIYRITELFNPHSCAAHIAKKALCSGQRGHKDLLTDIQDIIDTAERWKEMLIEDEKSK